MHDPRAPLAARSAALAIACVWMLCAGCSCPHGTVTWPDGHAPIPDSLPPSYTAIAAGYNARVTRLERFWTPVDLRLKGVDREGKTIDEDAGGYLQVVRPRNVALSVNKLEKTYFYLGSSDTNYWWFDLLNEPHVALVGTHEHASPQRTARFGLPVHPLDLLDAVGITPLPADSPEGAEIEWVSAKAIRLSLPSRGGGTIRTVMDARSFEPVRITIFSPDGTPLVNSELSEYVNTAVIDDASLSPRVAGKVVVSFNAPGRGSLQATLRFVQPENRAIKPVAFDLAELRKRYNIAREINLDDSQD